MALRHAHPYLEKRGGWLPVSSKPLNTLYLSRNHRGDAGHDFGLQRAKTAMCDTTPEIAKRCRRGEREITRDCRLVLQREHPLHDRSGRVLALQDAWILEPSMLRHEILLLTGHDRKPSIGTSTSKPETDDRGRSMPLLSPRRAVRCGQLLSWWLAAHPAEFDRPAYHCSDWSNASLVHFTPYRNRV
jgi:hypothetical protein